MLLTANPSATAISLVQSQDIKKPSPLHRSGTFAPHNCTINSVFGAVQYPFSGSVREIASLKVPDFIAQRYYFAGN
jgi:hypothetical protein